MTLKLNTDKKVVGTKQVRRAGVNGKVDIVYGAKDAEKKIINEITTACNEKQIEIIYVESMRKLGEACNIDVSAASAALLK